LFSKTLPQTKGSIFFKPWTNIFYLHCCIPISKLHVIANVFNVDSWLFTTQLVHFTPNSMNYCLIFNMFFTLIYCILEIICFEKNVKRHNFFYIFAQKS
jgi:hypothetical protein